MAEKKWKTFGKTFHFNSVSVRDRVKIFTNLMTHLYNDKLKYPQDHPEGQDPKLFWKTEIWAFNNDANKTLAKPYKISHKDVDDVINHLVKKKVLKIEKKHTGNNLYRIMSLNFKFDGHGDKKESKKEPKTKTFEVKKNSLLEKLLEIEKHPNVAGMSIVITLRFFSDLVKEDYEIDT